MERDGLPRLPAKLVDALAAASSDVAKTSGAIGVRRTTPSRFMVPKSAGTGSPHRRYTAENQLSFAGPMSISNEESTADGLNRRQLNIQPSPQSARPSSTRATPRQTSRNSNSNQVTAGDAQTIQLSQAGPMTPQSENELLRREISVLQQRLVEKIRGSSKILVSGGQFRASASSPQGKSPSASPSFTTSTLSAGTSSCSACVTLRASFKKARETADQELRALTSRISQLERGETMAQANLNQQEEELSNLREQLRLSRANEVTIRAKFRSQHDELHKLQDVVSILTKDNEALRSQVAVRDLNSPGRSTKGGICVVTQTEETNLVESAPDQNESSQVRHELLQTQTAYADLVAEAALLRSRVSAMESHKTQLLLQWKNELGMMQEQLKTAQAECAGLNNEKSLLFEKSSILQEELNTIRCVLAENDARYKDETVRWQLRLTESEERLSAISGTLAKSEAAAIASDDRCVQLEALLLDSSSKTERLEGQVRDALNEIHHLKESLDVKALESTVLLNLCGEKKTEVAQAQDLLAKTKADLIGTETQLRSARQSCEELTARLTAADAENAAREAVLNQMKRSHAAVLEKALHSFVRLCVVAPTVNVHLTGKAGGPPASSSVVSCRPTLPHDQVRTVVERDVLPMFATVFVQAHENCSPQGGLMDSWLQILLRDMQESLATQLQKLYSATTATPAD